MGVLGNVDMSGEVQLWGDVVMLGHPMLGEDVGGIVGVGTWTLMRCWPCMDEGIHKFVSVAWGSAASDLSGTGVLGGGRNDSMGTMEGALTGAEGGGHGTFLMAVVGGIGGMCGKVSTDDGVMGWSSSGCTRCMCFVSVVRRQNSFSQPSTWHLYGRRPE